MTHSEAKSLFKRCRNKDKGYLLSSHTRLQKRGMAFAVKYHDTDIIMIRPNNTYRINSGGWRTMTTRKRINQFSPCNLKQTKGIWHIGDSTYKDGMVVDCLGKLKKKALYVIQDTLEIKKQVDKRFKKFIQIILDACEGKTIREWETWTINRIPSSKSKYDAASLWSTVTAEISRQDSHPNWPYCLFIWFYFANNRNHCRFNSVRRNIMDGNMKTDVVGSLRSFMALRKPLIIEMIMSGELSIECL